jgi:uncharacterized protein (DUF433 family)
MTSDPAFSGIVYRRGASGRSTPVLRGTGIRVQAIAVAAQHWRLSAVEIADEYGVGEPQFYEALVYHAAHEAETLAAEAAEGRLAPGHD